MSLFGRAVQTVRRVLISIALHENPRICLSTWLSFRVLPHGIELIDNLGDAGTTLSREEVMEILTTACAASLAGDIREVILERITVRFDARPKQDAIVFDEHPFSWLWKPSLISSAIPPTLDYIWITIRTANARTRGPAPTAKLVAASRQFLSNDGSKPAQRCDQRVHDRE